MPLVHWGLVHWACLSHTWGSLAASFATGAGHRRSLALAGLPLLLRFLSLPGASATYPIRCCVVCGLQIPTCMTIAHLDHNAGNNEPDNLAFMCQTHHWMYDAGLYPIEAIRLLRGHWQTTKGAPSHKTRMKDAGAKAARTRKWRAAGRKAVATRRRNLVSSEP